MTLGKAAIREAVRAHRAGLSAVELDRRDAARAALVLDATADRCIEVVACYLSVAPEPGTEPLVAALARRGITVLLPVLSRIDGRRRDPDWAPWAGPAALQPAWRGVSEPTTPPLGGPALATADLIILPGLAGTSGGTRLGTGGGWYDRALGHARPGVPRWLLLNAEDVVPALPQDPWDVPVDALVTDQSWIPCTSGSEDASHRTGLPPPLRPDRGVS
jgi:5-formyltetrahydrofolate cyclo-ligase